MSWFYNLKIKTKLLIGFGIIALITAITGYISYSSINKLSASSALMYEDNLVPISNLQRMTASFGVIRIRIREMFTAKTEKDLKTFSKSIDKEIDSMKILSAIYEKTISDETDKKNWTEFKSAYDKYMEQILFMRDLLFAGKKEEALEYMNVTSKPMAVQSRNSLDKVVDYNLLLSEQLNKANIDHANRTNNTVLFVVIFTVLIACGLGLFLANIISRPINLVMERLDRLSKYDLANLRKGAEDFAEGKLDIDIKTDSEKLEVKSADETGKLSETINNIIDVTQASIQSVEHVTNTVTLMAKEINTLVDASVKGNLSRRADTEKFMGGFKDIFVGLNQTLDAIIGPLNVAAEYVDRISKGNIPAKITVDYKGDFNELKANLNTCIDAVNLLITDTNYLAKAAVEGNLSARADASKHFGDFRKIIQGINNTMDAVINPLNVAADYIDRIAKGDIPPQITETYYGDFNKLKENLNICIVSLNSLVNAMVETSRLQSAGDIDAYADENKFTGVYQELIKGFNGGMKFQIKTIMLMLDLLKKYSLGDLSDVMPVLPGKQVIATERINQLRQNVLNLIKDTRMLSEAAINGAFETRANKDAHAGDFARIIEGINNTLDTVVDKIFWFEGLLDSIQMPISVTDLDMKWTFINKSVETMLNVKRKDILGDHCSKWNAAICGTDKCGVVGLRKNIMQTEFAQIGKNFQVDSSYILNRKGEKIGHIEVVQDITTKIKAAEYSKTEVERLAGNLKLLASGNLGLDLNVAQGDEYTKQEKENFMKINESLSAAKNAVTKLTEDAQFLAESAIEGNLSNRADAGKHLGEFRRIVEGFNDTLDSVITPIKEGVSILEKMASGDLTVRINSEYKGDHQLIKNSINSVAGSLNKAMLDVSEAVNATASASNQISSSTEEMAAGANNQTQQTAEVASGVEEMTKTILENTKNATHAADAAKEAGDKAKEGGRVVSETIAGMNKISDVVKKSAETVQELGKSSDQIGEIVQVIDDIADQTNLLALNAAIEAARAGEQGRGFAVVADEVRKLAERTTKATKEIATMIRQIQKDTNNAVQSMEEGTKEVDRGKTLANKAGDSLLEIVSASQKVLDIIAQVAAASEEQSTTAEEISRNIESINALAQEGASGNQQIAKAAEDLTRLTLNLEGLVNKFRLSDESSQHRTLSHKTESKHIGFKGHKGYLQ